jgi:hypothetical protein
VTVTFHIEVCALSQRLFRRGRAQILACFAMHWQQVAAEQQASVVQAAQGEFIVIRDASEVQLKRSKIVAEGGHQAQAIVDFDYTLTRYAAFCLFDANTRFRYKVVTCELDKSLIRAQHDS